MINTALKLARFKTCDSALKDMNWCVLKFDMVQLKTRKEVLP